MEDDNIKNLPAVQNSKVTVLDRVYKVALNGLPHVDKPLDTLVNSYISNASSKDEAIKKFIRNQKIKCGTTGFLTGLGGLLSLPVTIPADVASSLYIEMRMIAGIAMIRGYNIFDDQVKTLVYLCLVGNAAGDAMKQAGIQVGEKIVIKKLLPKLNRKIINKINQLVGFRLLTKNGSKGILNLGKMVPILGGVIGGGWNIAEVGFFANQAKKMFTESSQ
ncbi:MAG: EcsC family protein [Bacteroidales bacterium]|nr:EcsC family protein [Bacteroidales bacterium]